MNLFTGISQLLESPSGVFSLISLAAISIVTWHAPVIGAGAFVAFFAIVPAALTFAEHRETMQQMNLPPKGQ